MIETLRIENLAILERAEIEFGPGLNVITCETGAGKSIVLGALSLLAGGRASADSLRDGSEQAIVEAVFRTEGLPKLEAALAARGLEVDAHEQRSINHGAQRMDEIPRGVAGDVTRLVDLQGQRSAT